MKKSFKGLENELVIVSGLAKGIDTAAHMAALQNGGKTIAVIGTGLDVFYPKANKRLQDYIGNDHLVLSEYGPGEQPLKFHFPARNRIIAGLCRGVIVAEAKMRSGSLITCERAMEEGRDVFAIPGSILDGLSDGCHHLTKKEQNWSQVGRMCLQNLNFNTLRNLFKPRQLHLAVLKYSLRLSFLVCSLIFIEYKKKVRLLDKLFLLLYRS